MKQAIKDAILGIVLGLIIAYLLVHSGVITLFEDGSVQFFNHPGWGLCVLPWGC
jgi:hypothetical protein